MSDKSNPKDICQIFCFNREKVNKIKKIMISLEKLNSLVEIFEAISDHTRLKILLALKNSELCVCDIAHVLGISLSAISHQLRWLRGLGLVRYRSQGRMVFYALRDKHIIKLIEEGIRHITVK